MITNYYHTQSMNWDGNDRSTLNRDGNNRVCGLGWGEAQEVLLRVAALLFDPGKQVCVRLR